MVLCLRSKHSIALHATPLVSFRCQSSRDTKSRAQEAPGHSTGGVDNTTNRSMLLYIKQSKSNRKKTTNLKQMKTNYTSVFESQQLRDRDGEI